MRHQSPLKALGAVAALTSLLIALAAFSPAAQKAPKKSRAVDQGTGAEHLIQGGTFEASGVVHVAGTDGFLFVDDGRDDAVFWLRVDKDGRQLEPAVAIRLASASATSKASPPTARGTTPSDRSRSRSS